jgi:hypothetical protein
MARQKKKVERRLNRIISLKILDVKIASGMGLKP